MKQHSADFRFGPERSIVRGMPRSAQPGLHDPYWYEATVGLRYVVDLLDPETRVVGVTFQQPAVEGLDDVVVSYANGERAGVQVKHTRVEALLTFNDLVRSPQGGVSLLRKLARGWKTLSEGGVPCTTRLFSNRRLSQEAPTGAQTALWPFLNALTTALADAARVDDVRLPPEHHAAWAALLAELDDLDADEQLRFLRTLRIDGGRPDLAALEAEVIARLTTIFGNPPRAAVEQSYDRLVRHLATWTTSRRETATEVHAEDVLAAIGVPHEETVGEHDFPPPAPFFPSRIAFAESLGASLRERPERVIFLTGPAGCGKTSIVSTLANRVEPVVDLRFYAFRPISPTTAMLPHDYSQTATAVALWGDLLLQLRTRHFVGRLSEAHVPARNDLLANDPARLREHVLRLAAYLAAERGQPTVIAIDGLDHAARARTLAAEQLAGQPSLLDWLVPPGDVPEGVRFLIAGQPQFDRYPAWLRERDDVRVVEVPPIAPDDIEMLLRRDLGDFPEDQVPRAAAIISEQSAGNTLAAVYAVAEARALPDALALQTRLETRLLHDGVEAYYDRIWDAALAPLRTHALATPARLAAALALSSARITGTLLRGFYPDAPHGAADWEQVLRGLAPIVEERDGSFAVRHNDVRVFLTGKLRAAPGAHAAAAASIADYYLAAPTSPAKYADVVRALTVANRQAELPAVFTPAYVVEAWTVERPIAELVSDARQAVAGVRWETGWETLHRLALGLRTLRQLRAALQWLDEAGPAPPIPACLPSEARPTPRAAWTVAAVAGVMNDASWLATAGEIARARDLLRRWFDNLPPVDVVDELRRHPGDLNPVEQRDLDETLHQLVRAWGELAQRVGIPRSALRAPLDGEAGTTMAHFYGGWLTAGVTAARPWEVTLRLPRIFFYRDEEAAARELARVERWRDVAASLRRATDQRAKRSPRFQIIAAPWALRTGDAALVEAWAQPIAAQGFDAAAAMEYSYHDNDLQLYEAIAFTLGWLEPTRPAGAISGDGADAYFARRAYETGEAALRRHLYATATVARLERAAAANPHDLGGSVRSTELDAIVRGFFTADGERGHEITPFVQTVVPTPQFVE
ncbi:MAG: ATP-binding protein, partial [Acidobacteriota bacterium]